MLAFASEYYDQSFKSPQEAQDYFKAPFLGSIPKNRNLDQLQLINVRQKNDPAVYSMNSLSDQIYLFVKDRMMQTILFTSSDNSSFSQSALVANLAHVLSHKTGLKVAVVDADMHNSIIQKIFEIKDNIGMAEFLEDKIKLQEVYQKISDNLCVIPAGKTELNPVTLLNSNHMRGLLDHLQKSFDVVLINGPDLKQLKEVGVLSVLIKKIVMVIHEGKTRRHTVRTLISSLIQKDVELVGIIFNQRKYFIPKMIYDRV